MDVYQSIKARASIRSYKADPIPDDKLKRILEAVRLAPSACNIQPWKFIVISDHKIKKSLIPACNNQSFIAEAPLIICACALEKQAYGRMGGNLNSYPIDLAIAMDHLTLMAVEEGLATCWIGSFKEQEVKNILGVPEEVRVVALTPLGYPNMEPSDRHLLRKDISEIICYDKWSN